jgi:2,5-diketo-D-gluconate reductase A
MGRELVSPDGRRFPLIGLGVMQIADGDVPKAMRVAVEMGYRAFDTAPVYGNEKGVGRGVRQCGLPREEVMVTTKLWNDQQGYDEALRAFDASIAATGLDYIDMYLIHWPVPGRGKYIDSWRALVRLKDEGRVRAIGVSNFMEPHLERIIDETGVVPAMNQVELHPKWQQRALRAVHRRHGIVTQAWSPLGRGSALADPQIEAIAAKLGCTPAQAILAWLTQSDIVVIPKASSESHMRQNIESFAVNLDAQAIAAMEELDRADGRFGPDPMVFERIAGR